MKRIFQLLLFAVPLVLVLGVIHVIPRLTTDKGNPREYADAMSKLESTKVPAQRREALGDAALQSARMGKLDQAERLALELETSAPGDGNDLEDLHTALGLVALKRGDIATAKERLLASGRAPETPVRSSFGPTMVLAQGLLKAGEKEAVLQFFELCRNFWSSHANELDGWARDVKWGIPPNFSGYLK